MESCLRSRWRISLSVLVFIPITSWIISSIISLYREGSTQNNCWNMITSIMFAMSWAQFINIWLNLKHDGECVHSLIYFLALFSAGPILMILSMIGLNIGAIDYSCYCESHVISK